MDNTALFEIDLTCATGTIIYVKNLNSSSKNIIPINNNYSNTINYRFNNYSFLSVNLNFSKVIISQLIGHLLGDGSLYISKTSVTPKFIFTQTLKRFDYT